MIFNRSVVVFFRKNEVHIQISDLSFLLTHVDSRLAQIIHRKIIHGRLDISEDQVPHQIDLWVYTNQQKP
jgi:hypothetical protein